MIPAAGLLLGDRYELLDRIAVGGMGEVWRAQDRSTGEQVAAKVLRAELAGDERFLSRLRAEASNSSGLHHPNLAALLDHGEQENSGYLVMELVEGEPMSQRLKREGTLEPSVLLPILTQTARALQVVHDAGVIHRDVKPSNIILTPAGQVKLTDFGVSLGTDQEPMTAAGMVMGTAQYLPPEQAMGRPARPAGDIYALGIVAFEALAGRRPYTGATQVDIAFAHVNEPLPPLPEHVPEPLRTVVEQMLAKDPVHRPASATLVAGTLDRVLEELGGHRRPAPVVPVAHPIASPASPRASSPRSAPSALPVEPAPVPSSVAPAAAPPLDAAPVPASVGAPPRSRAGRRGARGAAPAALATRWQRPTWGELAADRIWTRMVGGATLVAVVLALLGLGTLDLADSPAPGGQPSAPLTPTTAKDG